MEQKLQIAQCARFLHFATRMTALAVSLIILPAARTVPPWSTSIPLSSVCPSTGRLTSRRYRCNVVSLLSLPVNPCCRFNCYYGSIFAAVTAFPLSTLPAPAPVPAPQSERNLEPRQPQLPSSSGSAHLHQQPRPTKQTKANGIDDATKGPDRANRGRVYVRALP
jgi:hypothetical protein